MGDGDLHADAFGNGDDHGTVAVDALDDAFDAQEGTCRELDPAIEIGDRERTIGIGTLAMGIIDTGGPDQIVHR